MSRKTRKNVGIIGLGIIGTRVAARLRAHGFHTYVWSRSPHPVPNFLSSPAELADVCDTIQIFVSDPAALSEVISAMADKLEKRHTIICSATVGLDATREAAKIVESRGAQFLDAPFTGSKNASANGELVYFIGGSDQVLQKVGPLLAISGKQIVKVGEIGDAAVVKIVTNLIASANVQILTEALAIVKSAGLDPAIMTRVMEHHGTRSALIDQKLAAILQGELDPHFTLKNMLKDLNLGLRLSTKSDLHLPATTATTLAFQEASDKGWADLDYAAIAKTYGLGEKPPAPSEAEIEEPAIAETSDEKAAEDPEAIQTEDLEKPDTDSGEIVSEPAEEKLAEPKPQKWSFFSRKPSPIAEKPAEEKSPENDSANSDPAKGNPANSESAHSDPASEFAKHDSYDPADKPANSELGKNPKKEEPKPASENLTPPEAKEVKTEDEKKPSSDAASPSEPSSSLAEKDAESPALPKAEAEIEKPYVPIFAKIKPVKKEETKPDSTAKDSVSHEDKDSKQIPEEPKPADSLAASVSGVLPKRPAIKVHVPAAPGSEPIPQPSVGFFKRLFGKKSAPIKPERLPGKPLPIPVANPPEKPADLSSEKSAKDEKDAKGQPEKK